MQLREVEQRARNHLSFAILGPTVLAAWLSLLLSAVLPSLVSVASTCPRMA